MAETQVQSGKNFSLLVSLTKREFKLRYLGSLLGSYWNLIHPLVMILIYTVIFSRVMKAKLGTDQGPFGYSIYLCSAVFAWNLFQEAINRCSMSLLENAGFLKKISIPPFIVFGASFASALVNFAISFGIFTLFLFVLRPVSISHYLLSLVVVALFGAFALGFGIFLGCLNVFLRDVQQLVMMIFQLWFWFTPIVYPLETLPDLAKKMLYFNPAFPYIQSMHQLLFFDQGLRLDYSLLMVFWAIVFGLLAWFTYNKSISLVRDNL